MCTIQRNKIFFRYVKYCMKLVHMLLAANIKPILVFDGRHLPAKAETESKRREYVYLKNFKSIMNKIM